MVNRLSLNEMDEEGEVLSRLSHLPLRELPHSASKAGYALIQKIIMLFSTPGGGRFSRALPFTKQAFQTLWGPLE